MRPIDPQIAGHFVDFIFDKVERADFDEGVNEMRRIGTDFQAVPGMRSPPVKGRRESHYVLLLLV